MISKTLQNDLSKLAAANNCTDDELIMTIIHLAIRSDYTPSLNQHLLPEVRTILNNVTDFYFKQ